MWQKDWRRELTKGRSRGVLEEERRELKVLFASEILGDLKTVGGRILASEEEPPSLFEDFFLKPCLLDDGKNGFEGDGEGLGGGLRRGMGSLKDLREGGSFPILQSTS